MQQSSIKYVIVEYEYVSYIFDAGTKLLNLYFKNLAIIQKNDHKDKNKPFPLCNYFS